MDPYLLDWANDLLRGVHVITAIAWVGSFFSFVMLETRLSRSGQEVISCNGVDG